MEICKQSNTAISLEDLQFLLPLLPCEPVSISKTIMYMGAIKEIG